MRPRLNPGLMLRTSCSSAMACERRHCASKPMLVPLAAKYSAARTPLRMAWWMPLILGTLRVPAESPTSTAPGISSLGMDWNPPAEIERAPAERISPPFRKSCIDG